MIEFKSWEKRKRAAFINSLSGFKSCNLIGTKSVKGQENLAIFSSVFHLGADPALLGMISRPNVVPRDTLEYLKESGYYTINHVHHTFFEKAHQSSARYDKEMSEFEAVQLEKEYLNQFQAPFVKASPVKIAMRLREILPIKLNGCEMIIGEIDFVEVDPKAITDNGHLDLERLGVITTSGLDSYHQTKRIARLSYAKPDQWPKVID